MPAAGGATWAQIHSHGSCGSPCLITANTFTVPFSSSGYQVCIGRQPMQCGTNIMNNKAQVCPTYKMERGNDFVHIYKAFSIIASMLPTLQTHPVTTVEMELQLELPSSSSCQYCPCMHVPRHQQSMPSTTRDFGFDFDCWSCHLKTLGPEGAMLPARHCAYPLW